MQLIMTLPIDQHLPLKRLVAAAKAKTAAGLVESAGAVDADDNVDQDEATEEAANGFTVRRGTYSVSRFYSNGDQKWDTLAFPASSAPLLNHVAARPGE